MRFVFLASVLTLAAIGADQFAAPILRTTAPLWATLAFLLLVWRRDHPPLSAALSAVEHSFSLRKVAAFIVMHLLFVLLARSCAGVAQHFSGSATLGGTLVGLGKLMVLAPTFLLLPFDSWKQLARAYTAEATAAGLVLAINAPRRILEYIWPWYGRMLASVVYFLSRGFVPGLRYEAGPEPTIIGPHMDIGLILLCSGIEAVELLSYVFAFVALLDWNQLRKGRAFLIYWGCLLCLLICNAFRIAILVVLGNRGFANVVASFHAAAGSAFFWCVFLVYTSLTYRWMIQRRLPQAA